MLCPDSRRYALLPPLPPLSLSPLSFLFASTGLKAVFDESIRAALNKPKKKKGTKCNIL
jgi:hypothetical protein